MRGSAASRALLILAAIVAVSLLVAAVSLAWDNGMAFDPEAWVVWSRELTGLGSLNTQGGPGWKPLPVLFITIFSLFSHGGVDVYFWLGVARAGALLGMFGAGAIAYRIGGWTAAIITAGVILVSEWWFYNGALGNAEPMMLAFLAAAILAQARGWTPVTVVALIALAITRPEVWPFELVYAVWRCSIAWRRDRRAVRRPAAISLLACLLVLAAWAVPDLYHSGTDALSSATGTASAGAAKNAAHPFLAVLHDAITAFTTVPTLLAGLAALALIYQAARRWRTRSRAALSEAVRWELLIAAASAAYILLVAVMTAVGFDGNPRYLIPALGGIAILTGTGAARIVKLLAARLGPRLGVLRNGLILGAVAAAVVIGAEGVATAHVVHDQYRAVRDHELVANIIGHDIKVLDCPGIAWTYEANSSTLAQLDHQSIIQSVHPNVQADWLPAGVFVRCAAPGWRGHKDD